MAEKLQAELRIIQEFLPKAPSLEETKRIVAQAITESGAKTKKDLGLVMKANIFDLSMRKVSSLSWSRLLIASLMPLLICSRIVIQLLFANHLRIEWAKKQIKLLLEWL